MIEDHLGDPDIQKPNPHKKSQTMRLWKKNRIVTAEKKPAVIEGMAKKAKRSKAAKKVAIHKRNELHEQIKNLDVDVAKMPINDLRASAIHAWEVWNEDCAYGIGPETRDRWAVNFARHELTNYDLDLRMVFGKIGAPSGRWLIKKRVLKEIAKVYPELRYECERQAGGSF